MSKNKQRAPRSYALLLVASCFLVSGAIRIWDSNAAIAQEVKKLMANDQVAQPVAAVCPPPLQPESLLAAIRERESDLDSREERINNREQVLRVSRLQIDERIAELEETEAKLRQTLSLADKAAEKDLSRITSVYENMKPANAAGIFETMDVTFAAGFLMRMRPEAAAGILSALTPESAYSISVVMAGRNARVPTE